MIHFGTTKTIQCHRSRLALTRAREAAECRHAVLNCTWLDGLARGLLAFEGLVATDAVRRLHSDCLGGSGRPRKKRAHRTALVPQSEPAAGHGFISILSSDFAFIFTHFVIAVSYGSHSGASLAHTQGRAGLGTAPR